METHMIFETHAHYDDEAFEQDREALLNSSLCFRYGKCDYHQ